MSFVFEWYTGIGREKFFVFVACEKMVKIGNFFNNKYLHGRVGVCIEMYGVVLVMQELD